VFYDDMQKIASDVLKEFKQGTIRYIDIVPGSGPADEPGAPTKTAYDLDAVAKGVSYKFVKDSLALSTDLTVTAAVQSGFTPNMRGLVEIDGVEYKIVQDISTPAAGTRAVWKWIVRKGS
jgi:hypothetical protein